MEIIISSMIFLLGLIIGSFLNVCIYRIPKEESIAFPPSHCGNCNHQLKPKDLIPVISYLFLKGKCRYCGEKVSKQYPLIELLTGILFLGVYLNYGLTFETIKYISLVPILIVIAIIDFKTEDIYTSTTIFGAAVGIVFLIAEYFITGNINLMSPLLGAIIPAAILGIMVYLGGMGGGDVELIALIGLFLGFKLGILNLFISFIVGGLIAIILMIKRKKEEERRTMAFGPYIAIATYITLMWGNKLLQWYVDAFF